MMIVAFIVAVFAQPGAEWRDEIGFQCGGGVAHEANTRDFAHLLPPCRHRPRRRRAAEQPEKLPSANASGLPCT
jgi:hypothetical protein